MKLPACVAAMLFLSVPVLPLATAASANLASRVRVLEDREQIRELLRDYGRQLDRRDFDGFARLFATDSEYVSGGVSTRGPAAIGASLREIMARNPLGFREPNFHVFFNEFIDVSGDAASSTSQSLYVVPGDSNKPDLVLMASYEDQLVREGGRWKFKRRVVRGNIPVPRSRPPAGP